MAKQRLRVHALSMSIDGYAAGPNQSLANPLGESGESLHDWVAATPFGRRMFGQDLGDAVATVDDDLLEEGFDNIGATVMGRNMFGPVRGEWGDSDWKGWWGENPVYHHPVFVLTHHAHDPIPMDGGTVFNFVTDGIEPALAQAFAAADGKDVRLGGGASTIQQYLAAGLVDDMHVAIAPVVLGSGERLFGDVDLLAAGYRVVERIESAHATHVRLGRGMIAISTDAVTERVQLDDTSWVDVSRGWLEGADELFETLLNGVAWQPSRIFRFEKWIDERRLGSFWSRGRPLPHPALADIHKTLQRNYKATFDGFGMIQYRNAGDGQAFHRDTDMRWLDDTVIAILTLGTKRPWLLRPRSARNTLEALDYGKGATHDLQPGPGDLIVMGGACQANWEHSVPYLNKLNVGIRISLQWRWARKVGKPFQGAGYSVPLTYDKPG